MLVAGKCRVDSALISGRCANVNRKPLVFDPVAVGATAYRREVSQGESIAQYIRAWLMAELLSHWHPTVIKGNAGEIGYLAKSTEVMSRGVDSTGSGFKDPAAVVKALARQRGGLRQRTLLIPAAIIVMTGVSDYISDGNIVLKVSNGHELVS